MKKIIKRIILLRHSRKGKEDYKNVIVTEGMEYARLIGAKSLRGRGITGVVVSPYMRTMQTAMALLEGAGDFTGKMGPSTRNITGLPMEEWIPHFNKGETFTEIWAAYPEFMQRVERNMKETFLDIIEETPNRKCSLVISHSPCTELAINILTRAKNPGGITIDPLAECEGVVLAIWDDGSITVEEEIRHAA